MATVSLRDLRKSFGSYTALDGISLDIADKEFLVLLGPSGCGKTTTMRMVAGLERPTSGDILIDGVRVNDHHPRDRNLAMVFQSYGLYPHMTVRDNIGYPLRIKGVDKVERGRRTNIAAAKVELSNLMDRKPAELSGGQRQRVALARALVREPNIFLMDEPLSNLDAQLRTVMRAQLKHLQKEIATTTIYVTHDQVEAMTLADRIVVMKNGLIQQTDAPAKIYAQPANTFVASFIGSPPMNLLTGAIEGGVFVHNGARVSGIDAEAGPVLLGQRPEHLALCEPGKGDLRGRVYAVELLGDSVLIAVEAGGDLINVKMPATCALKMDDAVDLLFDRDKLHFFDGKTGQRR